MLYSKTTLRIVSKAQQLRSSHMQRASALMICQKCRSLWPSFIITYCIADPLPLGMEWQPAFVHKAPYAEPLSSCRLLSLMTVGVSMAMLMLVLMAMLGVVITFCHGMPMIMVTVAVIMIMIMIMIMTATILTHFAVLWIVLDACCWL